MAAARLLDDVKRVRRKGMFILDKNERKLRLKTLTINLMKKYSLKHPDSCTHLCFDIKPQDVTAIAKDYYDVLIDSNVSISPATNSRMGVNSDAFDVYATDIFFGVKSKVYDSKNHFEATVRMDEAERIEIDISCEIILSFHFHYSYTERYDQISFRND